MKNHARTNFLSANYDNSRVPIFEATRLTYFSYREKSKLGSRGDEIKKIMLYAGLISLNELLFSLPIHFSIDDEIRILGMQLRN